MTKKKFTKIEKKILEWNKTNPPISMVSLAKFLLKKTPKETISGYNARCWRLARLQKFNPEQLKEIASFFRCTVDELI
jgi:hypothetical protein